MSRSLSWLLIHLIFSTKNQYPFFGQDDLLLRTHACIGGILRECNCPAITIGRTADHLHAFFQLARTQHVARIVEIIKSNSRRVRIPELHPPRRIKGAEWPIAATGWTTSVLTRSQPLV